MADGWKLFARYVRCFLHSFFSFFFFFIASIPPVRIVPDPFFHVSTFEFSSFSPPSFQKNIYLPIYLIDDRWEEEEEEEERVETSSIRWKKRRIDTNVFSGGSGG